MDSRSSRDNRNKTHENKQTREGYVELHMLCTYRQSLVWRGRRGDTAAPRPRTSRKSHPLRDRGAAGASGMGLPSGSCSDGRRTPPFTTHGGVHGSRQQRVGRGGKDAGRETVLAGGATYSRRLFRPQGLKSQSAPAKSNHWTHWTTAHGGPTQ